MNIDVRDVVRSGRSDGVARVGSGIGEALQPPANRPVVPRRVGRRVRTPERDHKTALIWRNGWRVSLSAAGLFATLSLLYLYRSEPATVFEWLFTGSSAWLSLGALAVPLSFFAVHLANRRYGPAIAAGQVLVAWLAVAAASLLYSLSLGFELGANGVRVTLALPVSLLLAQLVAVVSFDASRSIHWWKAPLLASVWSCVVFALTFYPAAHLGSDGPWFSHLTEYLAVSLMISVALLVPYWIARPMVRPLPGLAGY